MKWSQWEPRRDEFNIENSDKAISWAIENAIRVRGHRVFESVNSVNTIPDWVKPLRNEDLRSAINHRVTTLVTHFDVRTQCALKKSVIWGICSHLLPTLSSKKLKLKFFEIF